MKWVRLLQGLRDGLPYSKSNDLWAPLSQQGFVRMRSDGPPRYRLLEVTLSPVGAGWLRSMEDIHGLAAVPLTGNQEPPPRGRPRPR